jgi:hypothetical protein
MEAAILPILAGLMVAIIAYHGWLIFTEAPPRQQSSPRTTRKRRRRAR